MSPPKVIVFGPTGGVGSATALEAHRLGATVYLGMRDPSKPIPIPGGLPSSLKRIPADLSGAASLARAVSETDGAKAAFLYLNYTSPDHMRGSISSLKSAGVEFIVFLSSFTVPENPSDAAPGDFIAYLHAQVELVLEDIMGRDGYVAVRPGYFNTNALKWKSTLNTAGKEGGEIKIPFPDAEFDWISPGDIGKVCGRLLVQQRTDSDREKETAVYLAGPKMLSQRSAAVELGKHLGKEDLQVSPLEEEKLIPWMMEAFGIPEPGAQVLADDWRKRSAKTDGKYQGKIHDQAVANVQRYTGEKATTWAEWVKENYDLFQD